MPLRYGLVAADLIRRLPAYLQQQVSDDAGIGAVNSTVLEYCIESAEDECDGYIAAKVGGPDVPLAVPIPGEYRTLILEVAAWHLRKRIDAIRDIDRQCYEDAVGKLEGYVNGKFSLGINPPIPAASVTSGPMVTSSRAKVFGGTGWGDAL